MEPPEVVDNSSSKLRDVIDYYLQNTDEMCVVTGYLNAGALSLLKDRIDSVRCRLLLGTEAVSSVLPAEQFRKDLQEGLPNLEWMDNQHWLMGLLSHPNLEVRLYDAPLGILHAKAYVFPGVKKAIVGSSNFTAAGLTTNKELNVVIKQDSIAEKIQSWFDQLWQQSDDYKHKLIAVVQSTNLLFDPRLIYLKVLYEQDKSLFQPEVVSPDISSLVLADFQRHGYLAAKSIIERYGGVLIADSVGLGKTFVALSLIDDYKKPTLLICPASLQHAFWKEYVEERRQKDIHIDIIPMESVSRGELSRLPNRYELVVVDEAHHFRSASSKRWRNLRDWLQQAEHDVKVVMLTATPINNSIWDLYNQVRLITRDRDGHFHPDIPSVHALFKQAMGDKEYKSLYELLERLVVRRSRSFIRRHYPNAEIAGTQIRFPKRNLHAVRYSLQDQYGEQLYEEILSTVQELYKEQNPSIAALVQLLLVKRLESSTYAFQRSLKAIQDKVSSTLESISQQIAEDDALGLLDSIENDLGGMNRDAELASHLLHKIKGVGSRNDVKLKELEKLIHSLSGRKMIIFTSFKDTAEYIHGHLQKRGFLCGLVHGATDDEARIKLIQQFAPRANNVNIPRDQELNLLITTDVLGEGMNLQDADVVISYDLPWNPMRLVQRIGRVDRIGSPHPEIDVYNFYPDKGLDQILSLIDRLNDKLMQAASTVGLDEQVLESNKVDIKEFNALIQGISANDSSVLDRAEDESQLMVDSLIKGDLVSYLRKNASAELESIPFGAGTIIEATDDQPTGLFAAFRNTRTGQVYWVYHTDDGRFIDNKLMAIHHIRRQQWKRLAQQEIPEGTLQRLQNIRHFIYSKMVTASSNVPSEARKKLSQNIQRLPLDLAMELRKQMNHLTASQISKLVDSLKLDNAQFEQAIRNVLEDSQNAFTKEDLQCIAWCLVV